MSLVADSMGRFTRNLGCLERSEPLRGSGSTPSNQPRPPIAQPAATPCPFTTAASSPTPHLGQSRGLNRGPTRPHLDLSRCAPHLEKGKQLADDQQ